MSGDLTDLSSPTVFDFIQISRNLSVYSKQTADIECQETHGLLVEVSRRDFEQNNRASIFPILS